MEKRGRDKIVKEAKQICCDIAKTNDFGLTSKIQLALVIRNLVLDFHTKTALLKEKDDKIISLENQLKIMTKSL